MLIEDDQRRKSLKHVDERIENKDEGNRKKRTVFDTSVGVSQRMASVQTCRDGI